MEKVKFKQMKDGTKEEYLLLDKHEKKYIQGTADRLINFMSGLNNTLEGYQITRLEHSLQTATRALNDKADDEVKQQLSFTNYDNAGVVKYIETLDEQYKFSYDTVFGPGTNQIDLYLHYQGLCAQSYEPLEQFH